MRLSNLKIASTVLTTAISLFIGSNSLATEAAKTPQQFAALYMNAFNAKDKTTLNKLRYPIKGKSAMQDMMDEMSAAEMSSGVKYTKFEILPVQKEMLKPQMGIDGAFYQPNLTPTHMIKITSQSKNSSASTSFPIGIKNGVYYAVGIEAAPSSLPAFISGWQRCTLPQSNWSVMMPNEPEPGRAALEKQGGKAALEDIDAYGVVKNTADIKTCQHWMRCGEEGKRVFDEQANKEIFRAACTTYTPETLAKWFNDVQKNIDDAVSSNIRDNDGTLISEKQIELNGAPGKEFSSRGKDGTQRLGRVYWVKDSLFELTFDSKKENPDLDSANKFLTSLEVK